MLLALDLWQLARDPARYRHIEPIAEVRRRMMQPDNAIDAVMYASMFISAIDAVRCAHQHPTTFVSARRMPVTKEPHR